MDSTQSNQKHLVKYNEKIKAIGSYFGVSGVCAKYMFHRRRRGYPYTKNNDPKYLEWTPQLQNGFLKADLVENFDWSKLMFDTDTATLANDFHINIANQPIVVQFNKFSKYYKNIFDIKEAAKECDANGSDMKDCNAKECDSKEGCVKKEQDDWILVTPKKNRSNQKHIVRDMHFYIHNNTLKK